jgi:hypothetical protein
MGLVCYRCPRTGEEITTAIETGTDVMVRMRATNLSIWVGCPHCRSGHKIKARECVAPKSKPTDEARRAVLREWDSWIKSNPGNDDINAMLFFTHLQANRPDLLEFDPEEYDKWQPIQEWLQYSGRIKINFRQSHRSNILSRILELGEKGNPLRKISN